jgi:nucleoside-diphosphate-sugar epimerase
MLLDHSPVPVTILRPGAIYGPGDTASREWYFVKRVLDGRRVIVVSDGRFHQVASENVAELVRLAAEKPGTRVVNAGDEQAHSVTEIARAIAKSMRHEWREVCLPGAPIGSVGDSPWSTPVPFVLDTSLAHAELGYTDAVSYEDAIGDTCGWLREATANRDWRGVLPVAAGHYGSLFDYRAEDEFLATRKAS